MTFSAFAQPLDPDAQLDYTFRFKLSAGESLASADVEFVNSSSTDVPIGATPTIVTISVGLISGTTWGVTVWLNGNSVSPGSYFLRCRVVTDSVPARKADLTMKLRVAQA